MAIRPVNMVQRVFGVMFLAFFLLWVLDWELPSVPPEAESFRSAILEAGYIFPAIALVYLLVGVACVTDRFVPLAAVVLFPVTLNIVLYHVFLVQSKILLALFVVVPNAFLAYISREAYKPLFRSRL